MDFSDVAPIITTSNGHTELKFNFKSQNSILIKKTPCSLHERVNKQLLKKKVNKKCVVTVY